MSPQSLATPGFRYVCRASASKPGTEGRAPGTTTLFGSDRQQREIAAPTEPNETFQPKDFVILSPRHTMLMRLGESGRTPKPNRKYCRPMQSGRQRLQGIERACSSAVEQGTHNLRWGILAQIQWACMPLVFQW